MSVGHCVRIDLGVNQSAVDEDLECACRGQRIGEKIEREKHSQSQQLIILQKTTEPNAGVELERVKDSLTGKHEEQADEEAVR